MHQSEIIVQKHVENFCKILPAHVDKWKILLKSAAKPAETVSNYTEQLDHIQKATIKHLEEFSEIQNVLRFKICEQIEYEIRTLKDIVEQLNAVNHETRNKLSLLEKSTVDLNWDNNSELLMGSALQPPLKKILQDGFTFMLYFSEAMKCINIQFKNITNVDMRSVNSIESCFKVDLEDRVITGLLSKTQYINNEKLLI